MAFVAFNDRPGCFPPEHKVGCTSWPCLRNERGTNICWRVAGVLEVEVGEMAKINVHMAERRGRLLALGAG